MSSALLPIEVFCSYAQKDEPLLQELEVHLSSLKRQGLISTQHGLKIPAGTDKTEAIDTQLQQVSIILLLVSPDFLASDYCYQIQMQRAVKRHEKNQARVIPIIVRPCDWTHTPFAHLQCLPRDGKPITTWEIQDLAWHDVAAGIRRAIEDLPLLAKSIPHTQLPAIWNIPYSRNPFFIGRDDLLSRLHKRKQGWEMLHITSSIQKCRKFQNLGLQIWGEVEYALSLARGFLVGKISNYE